tara:strand:- start:2764 stop:5034 length:2271 start_codon:yes stop_codon:yes gene_type:complete
VIKVRIKKPMIEEELLVEDIKNLGLPPIIITRVLEEFAGSTFDAKKAQDIVGRMYKERSKQNIQFLHPMVDRIKDAIQMSSDDIGGVPDEFSERFDKIVKFNVKDKIRGDGMPVALNFKEAKALEKSLVKAAKKSLSGDLQEDAIEIITVEFNERYLKSYGVLFQNQVGSAIINYLKKHPTNWKELAKMDFNEAMEYVNEVSLTEEDEKDIVHRYKDGYYWINLGEGACELEGKRMGHCGRDDRGNLVSLRTRPKGSKASKSHVTLTYNENEETLYQIKGRENNAPDSEYWTYIKDFIDRFGVDEVTEDGEHSNDDFTPLLEFIEENTNAKIDTRLAELQDYVNDVHNGLADTDYINFEIEMEDYGDGEFAVLDVYVQFKVQIDELPLGPVEANDTAILAILEEDDFKEQISEISYMKDFLQESYGEQVIDTDAFFQIAGEHATIGVQVSFAAEDSDYKNAETREELEAAVQHFKYNFGEDDIENFREDIKEIMLNFIKEEFETEGKGKIADVLKTIEGIEEDYKHFFAEYDLEDPTEPIKFVLNSKLPIEVEAFSFNSPREIKGSSLKRQYESLISDGLSRYNEAMKKVFSPDVIKKILNNSIKKVNLTAYMNAKNQTRLNFPGFDLGEEDIQQYRYMGANLFDEVDMRYPGPIELTQKNEVTNTRLALRANAEVKWLDRVEDIEYMMRWVETIDGLWPRILEDMKPQLEDINLKLKAERKKLINSMMKRAKEYADQLGVELQENKRNIKLIIKK